MPRALYHTKNSKKLNDLNGRAFYPTPSNVIKIQSFLLLTNVLKLDCLKNHKMKKVLETR